jgi:hypothetical protein
MIHAGIDGFSRIPVYLAASCNNLSQSVLWHFLAAVGERVGVRVYEKWIEAVPAQPRLEEASGLLTQSFKRLWCCRPMSFRC